MNLDFDRQPSFTSLPSSAPHTNPIAACIARSLICCFSAGTSLRGLPFCSLSRRSNPWLGKLQGAKRKKLGHRPSEPQPTQTLTLVLVHNPFKPHSDHNTHFTPFEPHTTLLNPQPFSAQILMNMHELGNQTSKWHEQE